jgi:hypothetical protein
MFSKFHLGQEAARHIARTINQPVVLTRTGKSDWTLKHEDGTDFESPSVVTLLIGGWVSASDLSSDLVIEAQRIEAAQDEQERMFESARVERLEHDAINADYYREQRLIHESGPEEYANYVYGGRSYVDDDI